MNKKINYKMLFIKALTVFGLIAAIPHLLDYLLELQIIKNTNYFTENIHFEVVEYWFSLLNNESLFYLIIPFFIIEIIRYVVLKKKCWNIVGDSVTNVITVIVFMGIETIVGFLFLYNLLFWVYDNLSLPHLQLNVVSVVILVILADFVYYWDHRLMHRIGIGWATHTVHHSSPHFNLSVAYRFGPLDWFFPILFTIPLVMLGFNPLLILAAELFVQTFQTILHTEVIKKLPRFVENIINTPSHHRVHHGVNKQYWDKNYAGILIIWDKIFDTFEEEVEKVEYGVSEPINSVNPIIVFFHGFYRFYKTLLNTKGIKNKVLVFVKPPSWRPNN